MAISTGTKLGPYEVLAPLGAGGMGEVWKGRDTRLDRSVAIKVLPADFAANAQLKQRLEREAKTISQLNHPNICTLYDVGDGYLVMELIEGESLAEKLIRGPLPTDQVIRYGIEIAGALDKAHKAGVVHRDLKPGNIMITKSGAKLLDFGLAKPVAVFDANEATQLKSLTAEGTIVGTFQYMAPEQIEGGQVDARTDIFALGAVLYEMATGRHAFEGKSKASLIASILTAEPQPINSLQPMTPAALDRIVRTCMAKDPDDRWQSALDVAIQLRWLAVPETEAKRLRRSDAVPWALALVATLVAITFGVLWRTRAPVTDAAPSVVQTVILPPEATEFRFQGPAGPPAISPDSTKIVFAAGEKGKPRQLWVRSLDSIVPQPLSGTTDATFPFWSPDGRQIGFFAENMLKKIEVNGGAAISICNVPDARGGSWSPDGQTIIFGGRFSGISSVPASGGQPPVMLTVVGPDASTHRFPEFLPDGRHFLYLASPAGSQNALNAIWVGSLDKSAPKRLLRNAAEPHYFDRAIVFTRNRVLTVQAFDPDKLEMTGDAVPLREQEVQLSANFSRSMVTLAPAGTLVYQKGAPTRDSQITWFDRAGKILGTAGEPGPYVNIAISPDERSVLVSLNPDINPKSNIWSFDLIRNAKARISFNDGYDYAPVWAPDGKRLIYASVVGRSATFREKNLVTGIERVVMSTQLEESGTPYPTSWSHDGNSVLNTVSGKTTRADVWWLSLDDQKQHLFAGNPSIETGARFSPDGKWVAYSSSEMGQADVFIAPFPPTGARWQVSSGGGVGPRWRADGQEVFYVIPGEVRLVACPVRLGTTPEIGKPVTLFSFKGGSPSPSMFDVSRDGKRFIVNARIGEERPQEPLILMQNFGNEVRAALKRSQ